MDAAIFSCPADWARLLPPGTRRARRAEELTEHIWPLLALTSEGCHALAQRRERGGIVCRRLTLSSLTEPVLCVQRSLPRPDGTCVDPQEFPLPAIPGPVQTLLPLLGLRLLQMPLTEGRFP